MGVCVCVCVRVCVCVGGGVVGSQVPFQPWSLGGGANLPDNLQHLHLRNVIYDILRIK